MVVLFYFYGNDEKEEPQYLNAVKVAMVFLRFSLKREIGLIGKEIENEYRETN